MQEIDLDVTDAELVQISKDGMLALTLEEMKIIQAHAADSSVQQSRRQAGLGPRLTDCELEALAQTWSEHCKHKIFAARIDYEDTVSGERQEINSLFKSYIVRATREIRERAGQDDICLSVFKDNAGVITFTSYNFV